MLFLIRLKEKGELYTIGRTILFIVFQMILDIDFQKTNEKFRQAFDSEIIEIIGLLPEEFDEIKNILKDILNL